MTFMPAEAGVFPAELGVKGRSDLCFRCFAAESGNACEALFFFLSESSSELEAPKDFVRVGGFSLNGTRTRGELGRSNGSPMKEQN
jgi:hypothetical protein